MIFANCRGMICLNLNEKRVAIVRPPPFWIIFRLTFTIRM